MLREDNIPIYGNMTFKDVYGHSLSIYSKTAKEGYAEAIDTYLQRTEKTPFFLLLSVVISSGAIVSAIGSMWNGYGIFMGVMFLLSGIMGTLTALSAIHQRGLICFMRMDSVAFRITANAVAGSIRENLARAGSSDEDCENIRNGYDSVQLECTLEIQKIMNRELSRHGVNGENDDE